MFYLKCKNQSDQINSMYAADAHTFSQSIQSVQAAGIFCLVISVNAAFSGIATL